MASQIYLCRAFNVNSLYPLRYGFSTIVFIFVYYPIFICLNYFLIYNILFFDLQHFYLLSLVTISWFHFRCRFYSPLWSFSFREIIYLMTSRDSTCKKSDGWFSLIALNFFVLIDRSSDYLYCYPRRFDANNLSICLKVDIGMKFVPEQSRNNVNLFVGNWETQKFEKTCAIKSMFRF